MIGEKGVPVGEGCTTGKVAVTPGKTLGLVATGFASCCKCGGKELLSVATCARAYIVGKIVEPYAKYRVWITVGFSN